MLSKVKLALRITTTAFDTEITSLINDCLDELEALGVVVPDSPETDNQISTTVIAYCKWLFGSNDEADRWREIYDRKLAQFKTMTGFTVWEDEVDG